MKDINVAKIIKDIKRNSDLVSKYMPLGYVEGYPMLKVHNSKLCLVIPFLKYKVTGEVDKTLVFPIRYTVTYSFADNQVINFEDLKYNSYYSKIDFDKPIGYFRHDAIKNSTKAQYKNNKEKLFAMYDKLIAKLLAKAPYTKEDDIAFTKLLNVMLEPSLKPFYNAISPNFSKKYLVAGKVR